MTGLSPALRTRSFRRGMPPATMNRPDAVAAPVSITILAFGERLPPAPTTTSTLPDPCLPSRVRLSDRIHRLRCSGSAMPTSNPPTADHAARLGHQRAAPAIGRCLRVVGRPKQNFLVAASGQIDETALPIGLRRHKATTQRYRHARGRAEPSASTLGVVHRLPAPFVENAPCACGISR